MPTEGYIERNKAVCEAMDSLENAVAGREWPEGSEAWKYQRMCNPKSWQDYGYSVNLDKLMKELEARP